MKYTDEIVDKIIKYIESGNFAVTACKAVGISEDTYYRWIKEKPEFSEAVKKAEAKAILRNLAIIQLAAKKYWQAAAWFLERKDYKCWGRKKMIDIKEENPPGPIKFVVVSAKPDKDPDKGGQGIENNDVAD